MTSVKTYNAVAQRYLEKADELIEGGAGEFKNIAGNFLQGLSGYTNMIEEFGVTSENRKGFLTSLKKVKRYFGLVSDFPEFRKGELTPESAFPDLYAQYREVWQRGEGDLLEGYIDLAEQRLRGNENE